MAYNKKEWISEKTKILAEDMERIEEGIAQNERELGNKQPKGDYPTRTEVEEFAQPKGNYLTEHQKIKTINGQSLVGEGNIEISGGANGGTSSSVNYDLNVKAINHRGYSRGAPENTIPAYILSKKNGFTYVECDVSFTSDGVAVLLHDATIDRTSDGTGNINEMTYAEVLRYDFGSWLNASYAGVKIPTFTEFIMTCKGLGLHPYIELKTSGGYTQEQILQIVNEVEFCGMRGKVTYISFKFEYLQWVKEADNEARLGYVTNKLDDTIIAQAASLKTDCNDVFIDTQLSYVKDEWVTKLVENDLPVEVWTVNNANFIKNMHRYISGVTSDSLIAGKILYEHYLTYTPPEIEAVPTTGITVDPTSLVFDSLEPQQLIATVEPSDTTDKLVWSSSDDGVASVEDGFVVPLSKGECVITVTSGSCSAAASVTVNYEVPSYNITRNLTNCTSSSSVMKVVEGSSHTETLSAERGYTLEGVSVVVTMGGIDISDKYVNGTLTIESVTGDIVIEATATEVDMNVPQPVVDWTLTNITNGTIVNTGSGGATYNATISGGEYTSDGNGLSLMTTANAQAPYALTGNDNFTMVVRGRFDELSTGSYQRMFRSNTDGFCIFYAKTGAVYQGKLNNISDPKPEVHSSLVTANNKGFNLVNSFDMTALHTYVVVGDATNNKAFFYIDGELVASQGSYNSISAVSGLGIGNTQGSGTYYANKLTFTKFQIYNQALSADVVAIL